MNSISSEIDHKHGQYGPTCAGIVVGAVLLAAALNATPRIGLSAPLQFAAVATLTFINFCVWRKSKIPPMPISKAIYSVSIVAILISVVAVIDTFIGFSFGAKSIPEPAPVESTS